MPVSARAWSPIVGPQPALVWRLIAAAMLLSVLRGRTGDIVAGDLAHIPWPYHAITLTALTLMLAGPRLLTLAATAAAWLTLITYIVGGHDPHHDFIADEHLLFAAVPLLAAVSAAIIHIEQRHADAPTREAALADAQLWILRLCTLTALGFAALHKLNHDFLDPVTSCATLLGTRLAEKWAVPFMPPPPLAIVLAEFLIPLLLVLRPRAGVLALLLLAASLGHLGPYAFNALLAALALAFLPADSWPARPSPRAAIALVLALLATFALSFALHLRGGWWPYLLFEAILVRVAWLTLRAGKAGTRRPRVRPPGGPAHRDFARLATLLLLVAGLSPYLGLKFRLSFAMLSNLRADDERWNSLVIPRAVSLRTSDPFVHVHTVHDLAGNPVSPRRDDHGGLRPGMYSPHEFRRRYHDIRRRGWAATIALRYRGVDQQFTDLRLDRRLEQFVAALPREPMFQDQLSGARPQRCIH